MKNILRTSLYLTVFALAGILFQISCSVDSNVTNAAPLGKIVYTKRVGLEFQIWTCNYDGTNQAQIPIALPANVSLNYYIANMTSLGADFSHVRLSPDGQKVFFGTVTDPNLDTKHFSIYSCDLSGNNLTEIAVQPVGEDPLVIGGVY